MAEGKRLIDANAYIAEVCKDCGNGCEIDKECCILVGDLMAAPAVDAVEVVRCKDCKRYEWDEFDGCHVCIRLSKYVKEDFFCSYGERREA